jgi:RNA-directed DNA polymerase
VSELKSQNKPFDIGKWVVWEAYQRVKANKGAAGVDRQSIEDFEEDRDANLYKIWNRMSSGSYFPPPVRAVEIPKAGGQGVRVLGVPTVADRVAQTVVAMYLNRRSNRPSTQIRMATARSGRRWTRWADAENGAGVSTG